MKKKKTIVVKNPRLQKLRYNLRMIIIKEAQLRKSVLRKKWKESWEDNNPERAQEFEIKKQEIDRSINRSICICHVCGSAKKTWYIIPSCKRGFVLIATKLIKVFNNFNSGLNFSGIKSSPISLPNSSFKESISPIWGFSKKYI